MRLFLFQALLLILGTLAFSCKKAPEEIPLPEITLKVASPMSSKVGSMVSIQPELSQADQNLTYSWALDGKSISDQLNLEFTPQQAGIFALSLVIKNQSGKTNTAGLRLIVLKNNAFSVMGYLPSWKNVQPKTVRWNTLSHLCFSFLKVKADGSLIDSDVSGQLKSIVDEGHKNGVAVLISVGGGGTANFSNCLLNESTRQLLADNLIKFAAKYEVDGLDIDFEEFEGSSTGATALDLQKRAALENLYRDLRQALPTGKLLTAAVSPSWQNSNWGYYNCYSNSMIQYLDFVALMIYDQAGTYNASPYAQHADYQGHFLPSINHWLNNRQVPKSKILAGVPFYGYQFKNTSGGLAEAVAYRDIVTRYPNDQPESKDQIGLTFYNGKETILQKSNYVKNNQLGGIMIWEITQDATEDSKSLLTVIDKALNQE